MRALWSSRHNCSHNVSQKLKRINRFSELYDFYFNFWGGGGVWLSNFLLPFLFQKGGLQLHVFLEAPCVISTANAQKHQKTSYGSTTSWALTRVAIWRWLAPVGHRDTVAHVCGYPLSRYTLGVKSLCLNCETKTSLRSLRFIQYRTGVWKCHRSLSPDPSPSTG